MSLGSLLKELRKQAGYTQQNVADVLGTDRSTYAYYEIDKTKPSISKLQKLSVLYGLSVDELTSGHRNTTILTMRAPEPIYFPEFEDLQFFRTLNNQEKSLVLLYRSCEDKDGFMRNVRNFTDSLVMEYFKNTESESK